MRWDYRFAFGLALAISVALMAACGKGGDTIAGPGDQPLPLTPLEVLYSGDNRLPDAAAVDVAEIFGRIELKNLTLAADPENGTASLTARTSQIPEEKILVRVIDPGEDILIGTVNPDLTGHFKLTIAAMFPKVHLEISFSVIEDLNGNEQSDDLVRQTVPIALKVGKAASMEMAFSRTLPRDIPDIPDMGDKPGVQQALRPEAGFMLVTELVVEDANGHHEDVYGVNYETNTVIYDSDGDNTLEFGDDYVADDLDQNGIADSFEQIPAPGDVESPAEVLVVGIISKVSTVDSMLTVRIEDGSLVQVLVNPMVSIERIQYGSTPTGNEYFGPLTIDSGLVGNYCQIVAMPVTDGFMAIWILVSDEQAPAVP